MAKSKDKSKDKSKVNFNNVAGGNEGDKHSAFGAAIDNVELNMSMTEDDGNSDGRQEQFANVTVDLGDVPFMEVVKPYVMRAMQNVCNKDGEECVKMTPVEWTEVLYSLAIEDIKTDPKAFSLLADDTRQRLKVLIGNYVANHGFAQELLEMLGAPEAPKADTDKPDDGGEGAPSSDLVALPLLGKTVDLSTNEDVKVTETTTTTVTKETTVTPLKFEDKSSTVIGIQNVTSLLGLDKEVIAKIPKALEDALNERKHKIFYLTDDQWMDIIVESCVKELRENEEFTLTHGFDASHMIIGILRTALTSKTIKPMIDKMIVDLKALATANGIGPESDTDPAGYVPPTLRNLSNSMEYATRMACASIRPSYMTAIPDEPEPVEV